jgi:hypothetical protein
VKVTENGKVLEKAKAEGKAKEKGEALVEEEEKEKEKGEVSVLQANKRYYSAKLRELPLSWQAKVNKCKRTYRECLIRAMKGMPHPRVAGENQKYQLLASLCRELQRLNLDRPFYLSVRQAGWLLNLEKTMGQTYLQDLVDDGIIKETSKGFMKGTASEFIYLLDDL